jgi:hypothetical protein
MDALLSVLERGLGRRRRFAAAAAGAIVAGGIATSETWESPPFRTMGHAAWWFSATGKAAPTSGTSALTIG